MSFNCNYNSTRHHSHLPTRLQHRCWQLLLLAQIQVIVAFTCSFNVTKKLLRYIELGPLGARDSTVDL